MYKKISLFLLPVILFGAGFLLARVTPVETTSAQTETSAISCRGWVDDKLNNRIYPGFLTRNIGIGTKTPTEKLDISGNVNVSGILKTSGIKMSTNPGNGKVLTSDASGNASWQAPAIQTVPTKIVFTQCEDVFSSTSGCPDGKVITNASGYYNPGLNNPIVTVFKCCAISLQ